MFFSTMHCIVVCYVMIYTVIVGKNAQYHYTVYARATVCFHLFYLFLLELKEEMGLCSRSVFGMEPSQMSFLFFLMYAAAAGGVLALLETTPGSAQEFKIKVHNTMQYISFPRLSIVDLSPFSKSHWISCLLSYNLALSPSTQFAHLVQTLSQQTHCLSLSLKCQ